MDLRGGHCWINFSVGTVDKEWVLWIKRGYCG